MLKLTEIYSEVIQESANEDQARNILKKHIEDDNELDSRISKLKDIDPTSQNKHLPVLAKLSLNDDFDEEGAKNIFEVVQQIEKKYGASLMVNKKGQAFFNKDVEDLNIESEYPMDFQSLQAKMNEVENKIEKLEKLKQAQGKDPFKEQGKPEVDGEAADKIFDENGLRIYAGVGQKACVIHSKGTDWCIGDVGSGHYFSMREKGRSFYFVYDDSLDPKVPASRVVLEMDDEGTIVNVHDKRNEEDDDVDFNHPEDESDPSLIINGDEYIESYLDKKGVMLTDMEPIPEMDEDQALKNIRNTNSIEMVLGKYVELSDGSVMDLTKQFIKMKGLSIGDFESITRHPITKKFKNNYLHTALVNFKLADPAKFKGVIPQDKIDRFIYHQYKDRYKGDLTEMSDDVSNFGEYLELTSRELVREMARKHLKKYDIYPHRYRVGLPIAVLDGVGDDILKDNLEILKRSDKMRTGLSANFSLVNLRDNEYRKEYIRDILEADIEDGDYSALRNDYRQFVEDFKDTAFSKGINEIEQWFVDKLVNEMEVNVATRNVYATVFEHLSPDNISDEDLVKLVNKMIDVTPPINLTRSRLYFENEELFNKLGGAGFKFPHEYFEEVQKYGGDVTNYEIHKLNRAGLVKDETIKAFSSG